MKGERWVEEVMKVAGYLPEYPGDEAVHFAAKEGYGRCRLNGKEHKVHRLLWERELKRTIEWSRSVGGEVTGSRNHKTNHRGRPHNQGVFYVATV